MQEDLIELGLGRGIYSVAEASLLTGVAPRRIRRWFSAQTSGTRWQGGPALLAPDYPLHDMVVQLSFLDLMEIRFVEAFLNFGVSWPELRRTSKAAAELLRTPHPFATYKFKTDGHRIFVRITEDGGDTHLVQLRDRQHVFRSVVEPLLHGLEFDEDIVCRWWPIGRNRLVKVDPAVAFGVPVGAKSQVPTATLAAHALAGSAERTARWFEVDRREVRDAVDFEKRLAAA